MCGRIRQAELPDEYFATIFPDMRGLFTLERPTSTENVPPGSEPLVIHQLAGEPIISRWHWLYRPVWTGKGRAYPNARFDTVLSGSRWWAGPLKHGRMIIPADGWYEWTGEKPDKQPWYIRPHDGKPLWMAAISGWRPDLAWNESGITTGFAIVTDAAGKGMVDIHDRRPLVLTDEHAREWMDPSTTVEQAKELLSVARPESAFEWYEVTKKMGNSGYQGEDLTAQLKR
ncbi:SOS response-associated peptidase [Advenella incenata]